MVEPTLSPLDDRYLTKTQELRDFFTEKSLFQYKLFVELKYFINLIDILPELSELKENKLEISSQLLKYFNMFSDRHYKEIKRHEKKTNHDVKALEYFISHIFYDCKLSEYIPFIHFGLTSQDINSTANILSMKDAITMVLIPKLHEIQDTLNQYSKEMSDDVMLSFTHGQSAVPTTMGKELYVFKYRLREQISNLNNMKYTTKFGGAVGNFNAHYFAYPDINWEEFADNFIKNDFYIDREKFTTQISNYDNICNILNLFKTINNIINDLNIDCWLYISKGYLIQRVNESETGSSTMPHKVNPINFENSEGNICIANSLIEGITGKLSVSRLQRDLTDSTILRNLGVLFGYSLVSYNSTLEGLKKIKINKEKIDKELNDNKIVLSEGIQTIMRKHFINNSYETVKEIVRKENKIDSKTISKFISTLPEEVKNELENIDIKNYRGNSSRFIS